MLIASLTHQHCVCKLIDGQRRCSKRSFGFIGQGAIPEVGTQFTQQFLHLRFAQKKSFVFPFRIHAAILAPHEKAPLEFAVPGLSGLGRPTACLLILEASRNSIIFAGLLRVLSPELPPVAWVE